MKRIGVLIMLTVNIIFVENRVLPSICATITDPEGDGSVKTHNEDEEDEEKIKEFLYNKGFTETENKQEELENKPVYEKVEDCSVVVLSNIQNPTVQSLVRKYRYDAKGVLIPSSIQYYLKLPQAFGSAPILVPLKDKAFTPLGGFVRYYKEVPPIPQSW